MQHVKPITLTLATALILLFAPRAEACTSILVTKGASTDGSSMITYAADAHTLYGELYITRAADHLPGEMRDIHEWDTGRYVGKIPQIAHTFSVVGNMNEHQVSISETTFGGREELVNPAAGIDYGSLIYVALERSKTAREAVTVMTTLAQTHGFASEGETFSIADPSEVWLLEMVGKGKDVKGALWVARRVPDGYITAHANQARIRQLPLNDKRNTLYSKDVISFAREKGWFKGKDSEFSFADTYAPLDYGAVRHCEARVWQVFRRVAPSLKLRADYVLGKPGAEHLPLWVKPDKRLAVRDVMELMRDHFEGTELDMTKQPGAGPYLLPYRWRPMVWKVDDKQYLFERAASTQQTGFSFVAQMRSSLPAPIGGVLWFGVDDTYSTVYVPMYCGIASAPEPYAVGTADFHHFSWSSAFWVFNFVANYAYLRYKDMIVDVQKVQRELEGGFLANQAAVERMAVDLHRRSPFLAQEYLTKYSHDQAVETVRRWRKLGENLLVKFLDGNVRDALGKPTHPGYTEDFYRDIAKDCGGLCEMKKLPGEPEKTH
ncbi:MAG: C69 family dipeptidase [Myxococcota bacterium]|jgi:dipeptidase|nr:C69 family dipeptidase [Myxococcota bacterium]